MRMAIGWGERKMMVMMSMLIAADCCHRHAFWTPLPNMVTGLSLSPLCLLASEAHESWCDACVLMCECVIKDSRKSPNWWIRIQMRKGEEEGERDESAEKHNSKRSSIWNPGWKNGMETPIQSTHRPTENCWWCSHLIVWSCIAAVVRCGSLITRLSASVSSVFKWLNNLHSLMSRYADLGISK